MLILPVAQSLCSRLCDCTLFGRAGVRPDHPAVARIHNLEIFNQPRTRLVLGKKGPFPAGSSIFSITGRAARVAAAQTLFCHSNEVVGHDKLNSARMRGVSFLSTRGELGSCPR